jgi:threonyl-tRNA synthetase
LKNIDFNINKSNGAFYDPKIDFHLEDCFKITWQCITIHLDFQMHNGFDLSYKVKDYQKHYQCILHP